MFAIIFIALEVNPVVDYKIIKEKARRVPFPAITRFQSLIYQHYGESIMEEVCQRLYDGDLPVKFPIHLRECYIAPDMAFWWIDRYDFMADLTVHLEAEAMEEEEETQIKENLYVSVCFCLEDQITYTIEDITTEPQDRSGFRLDDYLIPIMNYDELEQAADKMLEAYLLLALTDRRYINPYHLAKNMGLSIQSYSLPGKVKSILFWKDSTLEIEGPEEIAVPAYTIVLNSEYTNSDIQSLSIFHECFHAEYHWLFYRLQELYNSDLKYLPITKKHLNQGKEPRNPLPILEWEAKQGSRALMMPRGLIMPLIQQFSAEAYNLFHHRGHAMESAGIKISSEWGVPKYLVRSRMIHLGWWEAQGALNYIQKNSRDGYYIRPFVFDHESCPTTTYTFFIQPVDAFRLYESNQEYRAQIDSGEYVYAEGHVCLSQHVKQTKVGPQLTQWANCHIDECCLRFQNIYVLNEHYEFRLESINSDEEYNRHYNEFIARGKALSPREATARQDSLIASLPHTPGEALKHLMKQKSVTQEELAEKALVSISTVKRWLKE